LELYFHIFQEESNLFLNPDKLYGSQEAGSHYQGQLGPRTSKHLKHFDFARAAREYQKLDRDVLTHDPHILMRFRETSSGFEPITPEVAERLIREINTNGFFHSRYDCEDDEEILQPIPYVLFFGPDETIWSFVRATDIKDYGEKELFGKISVGWGGHLSRADGPDFVANSIDREVMREEINIIGTYSTPKIVGTLMAYDLPVDRRHFGLIYTSYVDGEVIARESSVKKLLGRIPIKRIGDENHMKSLAGPKSKIETWTKVLAPFLPMLYKPQ